MSEAPLSTPTRIHSDALKYHFPAIRGEGEIVAHGTRQMPIWGSAFTDLRPDQKPAQRAAFARLRIYDLTTYLESLQQQ